MVSEKKSPGSLRKRIVQVSIVLLVLIGLLLVSAASAGYFLKRYLISHSEEWIGRKIDIGNIVINPFTFAVSVTDFKLYEAKGDSIFFSFDDLYVNARAIPILDKMIIIDEGILEHPNMKIIMKGEAFNFDDLVARFSETGSKDTTVANQLAYKYQLQNIELISGVVGLYNSTFQGGIGLEKINAFLPRVASDVPEINGMLDLSVVTGGKFKSKFNVNLDSLCYNVQVIGESFKIDFLLPFVDKIMYVSGVNGSISTDLHLGGSFDSPVSEANGFIRLNDFHLLDTLNISAVKLDRFEIQFDTVSAVKGDYRIRHVVIDNPYLKFDLTPTGNNLIHYFPEEDSLQADTHADSIPALTVEDEYVNFFSLLNKYFIDLGQAYAVNYYAIDSLQISGGNFEFGDYTLDKEFNFLFEDLALRASGLYSDQDSLKLTLNSKLNHSGILDADLVLMPKDTGDLKLRYSIDELNVSDFSPYSEYYVAHSFWDGVVYFTSNTTIIESQLDSKNHLRIKHLEVGDKVDNKTAYKLPLKLAVSLLKDVRGDVNLTIPVKGNLNDPKFRVFPIILKIVKDLIIKAAAAPYKLLARTFDANEDDLRDIKYDYLQFEIKKRQSKPANMLARVLNQKKGLRAQLIHLNNPEWEKNQYALFEIKRQYYMESKNKAELNLEDSLVIDQISRSDSSFLQYLKNKSGTEITTDIEATCVNLVGQEKITSLLQDMNDKRIANLKQYLDGKVQTSGRFSIEEGDAKEKERYRNRPRFLIRFDADSVPTKPL